MDKDTSPASDSQLASSRDRPARIMPVTVRRCTRSIASRMHTVANDNSTVIAVCTSRASPSACIQATKPMLRMPKAEANETPVVPAELFEELLATGELPGSAAG